MKKALLTHLLSLIFLGSALAQMDTCLTKKDIQAAKVYVKYLEDYGRRADIDIALLRFEGGQKSLSIGSLNGMNERLTDDISKEAKRRKRARIVWGIVGVVSGIVINRYLL